MIKNAMILLAASQESPFLDTPFCRVEIVVTSETDSSTGFVTKKSLSMTTLEGNRLGIYQYLERQTGEVSLYVEASCYLSNKPPTYITLLVNETNGAKVALDSQYGSPQANILGLENGLIFNMADGEKCVLAFYSAKSV